VLDPDDPVTLQRLGDLRRAQPADDTLKNLVGTLNAKLELCERLPFLAFQADREGFGDAAATFRELAAVERRSLTELLVSLRFHLDRTQASAEREPTT
jgi:hypothetical protein